MQKLFSHELTDGSVLFDDQGILVKAQKSTLMKELESRMISDVDNCILTPDGETCYVVDVMNCLRKLVKKDKQIFGAIAEAYCAYTTSICTHSSRIDHVFDSYHELSSKDCECL